MVYWHGGAAIGGKAAMYTEHLCRYAVECDMTIINCDYRLAPQAKAPKGINDGYSALKWVLANTKNLGIDPKRVVIGGESGGGYITAGVSMRLAQNNEGSLVKF